MYVTSIFRLSNCLSVRPSFCMGKFGFHLRIFMKFWYWKHFFLKICGENPCFIKIWQEQRILYMKTNILFDHTFSVLLRAWNVLDKYCRENQNTHFVFSNLFFFFSNIVPFMRWNGRIWYSLAGHGWEYSARVLHDGYLRLQTTTQNM